MNQAVLAAKSETVKTITEKVVDNLKALVEAVTKAKPAAVKGVFFKKAVIHTTMGPAIQFTFAGR